MGKPNNALLLFVVYGSAFLAGFCENLMNMGLMDVMTEFSVDSLTAQWLVTGYMIVATVMVTVMAFLFRRFKLRRLFFVGSALCIAGSALGLVSTGFPVLMIARLIQAAGLGMFIPMMMNTVLLVVPKNKLGSYMAIGGCMISFGPAFAPVVCGALVTALDWRSVFLVPLVGMVVLTAVGVFHVRNLQNSKASLDVFSLVLSALFLFCFSFGLAQIGATPLPAAVSLAVAVVSAIVFVLRQRRVDCPLIDLSPMTRLSFWPATLLVFVAMLTTFSLSVLLPLFFEGALGMSALYAGLVILVPVVVNSAFTLIAGRIMDRRGEWPLLPAGFLMMTVGAVLMGAVAPTMSVTGMFAASLVAFIGVGLVFSPSQTAGLRTLPPRMNPFGVALMTTFTQIAACAGPSLFIGILSNVQAGAIAGGASVQLATASGFSSAIMVAAGIAAVGFVVALLFSRRALKMGKAPSAEPLSPKADPLAATELASIMDVSPFGLDPRMPVYRAMREMVTRGQNGAPLLDDEGKLCGYVSDGDIMRFLAEKHPAFATQYSFVEAANNQTIDERLKELMDLPISELCTQTAVTVSVSASFQDVCNPLASRRLEKVPVVDAVGHVVGSVDRTRVLHAAMKTYLDQKNLAVD